MLCPLFRSVAPNNINNNNNGAGAFFNKIRFYKVGADGTASGQINISG